MNDDNLYEMRSYQICNLLQSKELHVACEAVSNTYSLSSKSCIHNVLYSTTLDPTSNFDFLEHRNLDPISHIRKYNGSKSFTFKFLYFDEYE